jgi:hypothetical protein
MYVKGARGVFEVTGRGSYKLVSWILREFVETREMTLTLSSLPVNLRPHIESVLKALLDNRLARLFKDVNDECDVETRKHYPKLCDALDALVEFPAKAWERIRGSKVTVVGDGHAFVSFVNDFPRYGVSLASVYGWSMLLALQTLWRGEFAIWWSGLSGS